MFNKVQIVIKRKINSANPGSQATETETTILSAKRRVVNANSVGNQTNPNIFQDSGLQNQESYLVYLEKGDPELHVDDSIVFSLGGEKTVFVKKQRPMNRTILKKDREIFCTY